MRVRPDRPLALGLLVVLVLAGLAGPAGASPVPVAACPPCGDGFVQAASAHGLPTEVERSEATVRVHENGTATWTVRIVPTNRSVLDGLASNRTLARAVAVDSVDPRSGGSFDHQHLGEQVSEGAFTIRYRTPDVAHEGPLGSMVLTYFRDAPGGRIYVGLGADQLTVVAPPEMIVAQGFGDIDGRRMTATALPEVPDGPFVVFVPEDSASPGVLGSFAVLAALSDVILRNLALFVLLPGGLLVGGLAAMRRLADHARGRSPERLGGILALVGVLMLVVTIGMETDGRLVVTGNLLLGTTTGAMVAALGLVVAVDGSRRFLTARRLTVAGLGVAILAATLTPGFLGAGGLHRSLSLGTGLLPVAVALGWADAADAPLESSRGRRRFRWLAAAVFAVLVLDAPLRTVGGSLFLLGPILLTVGVAGVVVLAAPLYLLGVAGATAKSAPGEVRTAAG